MLGRGRPVLADDFDTLVRHSAVTSSATNGIWGWRAPDAALYGYDVCGRAPRARTTSLEAWAARRARDDAAEIGPASTGPGAGSALVNVLTDPADAYRGRAPM